MFRRSLFGSAMRAGLHRQASGVHGSGSGRPFHAFSGPISHLEPSILGNLGMKLCLVRAPHALSLRSYIHSGKQAEFEAGRASRSTDNVEGLFQDRGTGFSGRSSPYQHSGKQADFEAGRAPTSMAYIQGLLQDRGTGFDGRSSLYQPSQLESNADIVHIKLMRNNAFVTVTDSKGNKKIGTSAGKLAGKAGKLGRYSGEAAAEDIGRRVRQMKTKSVVMKVNGFTFFRRKKDAILSFKDGYTNSRGDMNPIVYIEDTTRKPHNGCRRRKKRRI